MQCSCRNLTSTTTRNAASEGYRAENATRYANSEHGSKVGPSQFGSAERSVRHYCLASLNNHIRKRILKTGRKKKSLGLDIVEPKETRADVRNGSQNFSMMST